MCEIIKSLYPFPIWEFLKCKEPYPLTQAREEGLRGLHIVDAQETTAEEETYLKDRYKHKN